MELLTKIIRTRIDLRLPYFEMYEKFLMEWEQDEELSELLKDYSVSEVENEFTSIFKDFYLKDKLEVKKQVNVKNVDSYNCHNLAVTKNNKNEICVFNTTTGVSMSKTSTEKFLKNYSFDDITRVRLYCMFYNHSRTDDDFISNLHKLNIKWKPLQVKNPMRMFLKFPQISF